MRADGGAAETAREHAVEPVGDRREQHELGCEPDVDERDRRREKSEGSAADGDGVGDAESADEPRGQLHTGGS